MHPDKCIIEIHVGLYSHIDFPLPTWDVINVVLQCPNSPPGIGLDYITLYTFLYISSGALGMVVFNPIFCAH